MPSEQQYDPIVSFDLGAEPGTWDRSKDCREVAKRETVEDRKIGPKEPRSTVLSEGEEAMVVA